MKLLLVGDSHMTPDSLEEGERLMDFVYRVAQERRIRTVVMLGDEHHTHSIVRIEVTHFWAVQLHKASGLGLGLILLVGNHDMSGNASGNPFIHALVSYKGFDHVTVVDRPTEKYGIGFLPYYFDPQKFIEDANALKADILLCHQTFTGAKYENNFPAVDGVDPDLLLCPFIVSGHIHMRQTLGNRRVIYVGSPRWLVASDANQERGIHILDTDTQELEFISTAGICRPIVACTLTPDKPNGIENLVGLGDARLIITLKGPKAWASSRLEAISKMELSSHPEIRSVYVEEKEPEVRESEGLVESLRKYVMSHEWEVSQEDVWNTISSRVTWLDKR